jgi:hypothetical protein
VPTRSQLQRVAMKSTKSSSKLPFAHHDLVQDRAQSHTVALRCAGIPAGKAFIYRRLGQAWDSRFAGLLHLS